MRIILGLLMVLLCWAMNAQQLPQYKQINHCPTLYNPAAMSWNKQASVSMVGRWQFFGFGYEPRTVAFVGQTMLKKKVRTVFNPGSRIQRDFTPEEKKRNLIWQHYAGGQVISDNYGAFKYLEVNANYACAVPLGSQWKASGGIRIGLRNNAFNANQGVELNVSDQQLPYVGGDEVYDEYLSKNYGTLSPSAALGLSLSTKKLNLSAALSHGGIPNAFKQQTSFFDAQWHWNTMVGYTFTVASGLDIRPLLVVKKMSVAPLSVELNAIATINYIFWGGLTYQHNASAGIIAGMEVSDNLKIGYAFDFSTNALNRFSNGGHEIYLSYGF